MAYRSFNTIEEWDRRIFMAGLAFMQYAGFKTPREFCARTTLMMGDVDTDRMLLFRNTIDRDEKDALQGNTSTLSDYFDATIPAYVHPDHQERARRFFSLEHLRDSYERGRMTETLEYPCILDDGTMWIRACYFLEQDEDGGDVVVTIVLIDITGLHAGDEAH